MKDVNWQLSCQLMYPFTTHVILAKWDFRSQNGINCKVIVLENAIFSIDIPRTPRS